MSGLFGERRWDEARQLVAAALTGRPDDPRAAYWQGRLLADDGLHQEAAAWFERAIAADPSNAEYHLWRGYAWALVLPDAGWLQSLRIAGRVRGSFEKAVRLAPGRLDAREALFRYRLQAPAVAGGGERRALAEAEAIGAIDPLAGRAARARVHVDRGRPERAEEELAAGFREDSGRARLYLARAELRERQQHSAAAIADYVRALEINPERTEVLYEIGRLAGEHGVELERGQACLETFLERQRKPRNVGWGRYWLGRIAERRGKTAEAVAQYRAALAADPRRDEARAALRRLEPGRGR